MLVDQFRLKDEDFALLASNVVSARSGILHGLMQMRANEKTYDGAVVHTIFPRVQKLNACPTYAGSWMPNEAQAKIAALFEGLERYSAGIAHLSLESVRSSYLELSSAGTPAIEPDLLCLFTHEQYADNSFPFKPFDKSSVTSWVRCENLSTNVETMAPLDLIRLQSESPFFPLLTTGLAAGESREAAILNAVFEVIERDATMFSWWTSTPASEVSISQIAELIEDPLLLSYLEKNSTRLRFGVLKLDTMLPVVVAIETREDYPRLSVASACHKDIKTAAAKALRELVHVVKLNLASESEPPPKDPFELDSFTDLRKFFASSVRSQDIENLLSKADHPPIQNDTASWTLQDLVAKLTLAEIQVIVCDITSPELKDQGLFVYRALLPGLIPMNSNFSQRVWGPKRLYTLKQKLGQCRQRLEPKDLQHYPHPFP